MKIASEITTIRPYPGLTRREVHPPEDALDIETTAPVAPWRHPVAAVATDAMRCSIIASAACAVSATALMTMRARTAPLKMLLAEGLAGHAGAAASFLAAAHLRHASKTRCLQEIAAGLTGASLAGWGVNLLSDTTGAARMLMLKTTAPISLEYFTCFMLPWHIKADPRLSNRVLPIVCWVAIGVLSLFSQGIEEVGAAASTQKAFGNVPHIAAGESAQCIYMTAAAAMTLWGVFLGFVGMEADSKLACTAGALIGTLTFVPKALTVLTLGRA